MSKNEILEKIVKNNCLRGVYKPSNIPGLPPYKKHANHRKFYMVIYENMEHNKCHQRSFSVA